MTQAKAPAVAEALTPAGGTPEGVAQITIGPEPIPSIGAYRSEDHRYWYNGQGPVPGVTGVIGILHKEAVVQHKAQETARVCIRRWMELSDILEKEGEQAAVKWAVKHSDDVRDKAAALGSSVHLLADMEGLYATGTPGAHESDQRTFQVSDDVIPYLEAYRGFLARYGASSIVSSEKMVWSLAGYAGTYDALQMIDDELWLIDIKTSRTGPYPEWGLQLAAYRWADYIIVEQDPTLYPMPHIHRTGVLHLRPDLYTDTGWRLIEYPTDEVDYVAFLSILNTYQWKELKRFTKSKLVGRQSKPIGTS